MKVKHLENGNLQVIVKDLHIDIGVHNESDTDIVITMPNGKIINVSVEFNSINFFDNMDAFRAFELTNTRIVLIDDSGLFNQ